MLDEAYDSTRPAAFLNYFIFDEKYKVVPEESGIIQISGPGGEWNDLSTAANIPVNRNGYLFAYISSASNTAASFDQVKITYYQGNLLEEDHYYPYGLVLSSNTLNPAEKNNIKYSSQELQHDEFTNAAGNKSGLVLNDYGARMQDPQLGSWWRIDPSTYMYPGVSPYTFALDKPINAVDPDGNVVIFINGMYFDGSGGAAKYWKGYDERAVERLGDHSARYVDGAMGGGENWGYAAMGSVYPVIPNVGSAIGGFTSSNVNLNMRMHAGFNQGWKDAASIIDNLTNGETIKFVSHSMGAGFERGYINGLLEYARLFRPDIKVPIDYVLDVNAFQAKDLPPLDLNNIGHHDYKLGGLDGGNSLMQLFKFNSVPTVGAVPGANNISTPKDANAGHAIENMSDGGIPYIGNAGTKTQEPIQEGCNNGECCED